MSANTYELSALLTALDVCQSATVASIAHYIRRKPSYVEGLLLRLEKSQHVKKLELWSLDFDNTILPLKIMARCELDDFFRGTPVA